MERKPWRHGPHKHRECPKSPTGKHCFCNCDTAHDSHGATRTECCCWCGHTNTERTQSPSVHWTSGDDSEKHGPHKKDIKVRM